MVVYAGSLLLAAQALASAGTAHVADSRDQTAGGRRLRRQERDHSSRNHRGGGGSSSKSSGEDYVHTGRSFLGASRPPPEHHRSENRREERRTDNISSLQGDSRWRGVLFVRHC